MLDLKEIKYTYKKIEDDAIDKITTSEFKGLKPKLYLSYYQK